MVAAAARRGVRRRRSGWCSPRATGCCRCAAAIAVRNPDLMKSNGGGCNAILVRGGGSREHETHRLALAAGAAHDARRAPASGVWVVNLHASTRGAAGEPQTRAESLQAAGDRARLGGRRAARARRRLQPARHARAARAAARRRPLRRPRLREPDRARRPAARCSTAARCPTTRPVARRPSRCVGRSRAASAARAGRPSPASGTRRAARRRRGRRRTPARAAAAPRAARRRRRRARRRSGRSRRCSRAARGGCRAACTARTRSAPPARRSPVAFTRASGNAAHRRLRVARPARRRRAAAPA